MNENKSLPSDTLIFDNIHGYIEVDPIAKSIIDTTEFQRLRRIHQDGVLYYVFPTANHSRFEHSIGTYYLTKKMINTIARKQKEINITSEIIKVVSIAGLCHDLGHMMYSHLFDDLFLSKIKLEDESLKIHENRSVLILNNIVKKYKINISNNELQVIGDLINPTKQFEDKYNKWNEDFQVGKWIFQIVSNPKNSIDVDKFDYINRDNKAIGLKLDVDFSRLILQAKVIDDDIYYPIQAKEIIYQLFFVRYQLHRRIYHHKTVKAIEILIVDILDELEESHKISSYLLDNNKMNLLVDSFIFHTDNEKVNLLINKIETRNLPSLVKEEINLKPYHFDDKILSQFNEEDYVKIKYKIGYSNDKSNPLSNVSFYQPKDMEIYNDVSIQNFSLLTNESHQEYVFRIYCKNPDKRKELYQELN